VLLQLLWNSEKFRDLRELRVNSSFNERKWKVIRLWIRNWKSWIPDFDIFWTSVQS
jgi:hypothetical protein